MNSVYCGSWRRCLGHRTSSRLPLRHEVSHLFGPQGGRKHWQNGTSQCASPAVARVSYRIRLHPRVLQEHHQRKYHFLSRLPESATEHDRTRSSRFNPVEDGGRFLIRACGFRTRSSPIPGVALRRLAPHPESAVWVGLPFASSDFRDFRTHGPCTRIDDLFCSLRD